MDYSKWKVKSVAITSLRLDPENPRLATFSKPTQAELIAELLEHEDVLGLVRDIARQGYFPNELLVAFRDGGNVIVVEGNRRLAALKLLLNPDLAPAAYQKRICEHRDQSQIRVAKVAVCFAPSRAAAVPLIIARHRGDPVKKWTPIMQAFFLQSRVEDDRLSIDEVAKETGMERPDVVHFLRDAKLYDVIRSLPLSATTMQVVNDPRKFPFTTLRRLVDYTSFQGLLGVEMNEKYGFSTTLSQDHFQKVLGRVVTDIVDETVTSRTHNAAADVDRYIKEIEASLGKGRKGKKTPADEFVDPSKTMPKKRPKATPKGAKKQRVPIGLIPRGFRVDIEDGRICAIVEELKSIAITRYPNATAVTFRSLLDMAVARYLNDCGELSKAIAKLSKKQARPADWVPSLQQLLQHVLDTPTIPLGPEARKAVQKFLSDANKSFTLDALNWFTHIRYIPPTVEQLRSFWTMLVPLCELTLQTPS